jgi:hypothetical protein
MDTPIPARSDRWSSIRRNAKDWIRGLHRCYRPVDIVERGIVVHCQCYRRRHHLGKCRPKPGPVFWDGDKFLGCVIKLDGLANGKGVFVCNTVEEASNVIAGISDGSLIPEGYVEYR